MSSRTRSPLRQLLCVATVSAGLLGTTSLAQAGLLAGATGGLGGTLGSRSLDLAGQGGASLSRDGQARLPRGEKLREAGGQAATETRGAAGTAKGAVVDKAASLKREGGDGAAPPAGSSPSANANASAGVQVETRPATASASGTASASR